MPDKTNETKNTYTLTHEPAHRQSDHVFKYLTHNQRLATVTHTAWERHTEISLAGVRVQTVYNDVVEDVGMPEMIYTRAEVEAAELRAELMAEKIEDLVCTLVCNTVYKGPNNTQGGSQWIESVLYSQLAGRVRELRRECDGELTVKIVYSEETRQMFWFDNVDLGIAPRMPGYDQTYEKKRKGYRNSASGVHPGMETTR